MTGLVSEQLIGQTMCLRGEEGRVTLTTDLKTIFVIHLCCATRDHIHQSAASYVPPHTPYTDLLNKKDKVTRFLSTSKSIIE